MVNRLSQIRLLCLLVLCLVSTPVQAVMMGLSTEELTRSSDSVIVGQVEEVISYWSEDRKTIFSRATIRVERVIKGKTSGQTIEVEFPGGEVDGIELIISDMSKFKKGEKTLLFLGPTQAKGPRFFRNIVGKAQGKYTIGPDNRAHKEGFTIFSGREKVDNNLPLDELINRIRTLKDE